MSVLFKKFLPLLALLLVALTSARVHASDFGLYSAVPGGAQTSNSPAPVLYNGVLYLFSTGLGDSKFYFTTFDGSSWSNYRAVPYNAVSNYQPVVLVYNGSLYLFTVGTSDRKVYFTKFNGSTWTPYSQLSGDQSGVAPGVVAFNGLIYIYNQVYSGSNNSGPVLCRTLDSAGNISAAFTVPGARNTASSPSPVVYQSNIYLFVRYSNSGDPNQNTIYYNKTADGSNYTSSVAVPTSVGTSTNPSPLVYGNALYVFFKGDNGGGYTPHYYTSSVDGSSWNPTTTVDPNANSYSAPGMAVFQFNGLNTEVLLFSRGAGDQKIYYTRTTHR